MGKKRLREKKEDDFKKPKLKVGKKKAAASNFTDTGFKSRAISLPNQSISEDKSQQLTSSKNLTLKDLLVHLQHYNANIRKDGLEGIKELLQRYPTLLQANLGGFVNGVIKLLSDDDADVRKQLLALLEEYIRPLPPSSITPFLSILIIYTCSAATHIHEDIRVDAIKFMDLWVNIGGEAVLRDYWSKIIGSYLSLLHVGGEASNPISAGTAAGSVQNFGSLKSKYVLFNSLRNILRIRFLGQSNDRSWFFERYLRSEQARRDFSRLSHPDKEPASTSWDSDANPSKQLHHPQALCHNPYVSLSESTLKTFPTDPISSLFGTGEGMDTTSPTDGTKAAFSNVQEHRRQEAKDLITLLNPTFLATWLDNAPNVFSASNTISFTPSLQILQALLDILVTLWRCVATESKHDTSETWQAPFLQQLLKHYMIYFPFGENASNVTDSKVESILNDMNMRFCELCSLFLIANPDSAFKGILPAANKKSKHSQQTQKEGLPTWADQIVDYVLNILGRKEIESKQVLPSIGKRTKAEKQEHQLTTCSTSFRSEHLVALLPSLWGMLNSLPEGKMTELFEAILDHCDESNTHSSTKRILVEFIAQTYLIQLNPHYAGNFRIRLFSSTAKALENWIKKLPRLLWELKGNHSDTSRLMLKLLCNIATTKDKNVFTEELVSSLQLQMIPLFAVNIPQKGLILGPFNKLPLPLQQDAVNFLHYTEDIPPNVQAAVRSALEEPSIPPIMIEYANDAIGV